MKPPMTPPSRMSPARGGATLPQGAGGRKPAGTATTHAPIRSLPAVVSRTRLIAPEIIWPAPGLVQLRSRALAGAPARDAGAGDDSGGFDDDGPTCRGGAARRARSRARSGARA